VNESVRWVAAEACTPHPTAGVGDRRDDRIAGLGVGLVRARLDDSVRGTYRVKDENHEAPKAENAAAGMSGDAAVNNVLGAVNEPMARVAEESSGDRIHALRTRARTLREEADRLDAQAITIAAPELAQLKAGPYAK
jgi:hypothetical protein